MEGLLLIPHVKINDNDYHVVMGVCGEDQSYDNVWWSMKDIQRKKREKEFLDGWAKQDLVEPDREIWEKTKVYELFIRKTFY